MGKPVAIDLFCGAGGLTLGARMAGFEVLLGIDIDKWACLTFKENNPGTLCLQGDITKLDPLSLREKLGLEKGEMDLMLGGPPCEGFSIIAPERYIEDPRNNLFHHYMAFVSEFEPKFVLIENVPGMLSLGNGVFIRAIMRSLSTLGYDTGMRVLNAANYGIPQDRWRVFIIGTNLRNVRLAFPPPSHYAPIIANFTGGDVFTVKENSPDPVSERKRFITVGEAIGDLPALKAGEGCESMAYDKKAHSQYAWEMRNGSLRVYNHVAPRLSRINIERLKYIPPGGSWRNIPFELLPSGMKRARRSDHTRRYGRLRADGLAGTIMARCDPHWGPVFHYEQARTLTVRETARLQSFPDRYRFYGPRVKQYEQVGNAVPPLLARDLCRTIRQLLDGDKIDYPVRAITPREVEAFYERRRRRR